MSDMLFANSYLSDVLGGHEAKMIKEIDSLNGNQIFNTSVEDLCDYFEQEYKVDPLVIDENGIQVDQGEVQVDVSRDFNRAIFDRNRPVYIVGTKVTFYIPFGGDEVLLKCKPATSRAMSRVATVGNGELSISYEQADANADRIKTDFERVVNTIKDNIGWIERDLGPFNKSIRDKARKRIESRREKLLKDQGAVASLGFPLRARKDAPLTYIAPQVRRKIRPTMPQPSTEPFVPEPTLDMQEYEFILSVVCNMVAVMEMSPKAFEDMGEEDLRQHFLVQLNGHYEGQATGETFNFQGKTDILIRVEGKNIFVAECKFWRGPESLRNAIDQLLGYATWRDTKIALLVFNRERSFSTVLERIPEVVKAHPNFKREVEYESESGFRHILGHPDDSNRELTLTILAFEVPS